MRASLRYAALIAFSSEVARGDECVKQAYSQVLDGLIYALQRDLGDDGAQIGIFAADRGDFIGRGAGIQLCFEKLETLGDLDQAVFGQHSREVPAASWHVKAI